MENQVDVFRQLREGSSHTQNYSDNPVIAERQRMVAEHRTWLKNLRHEYPNPLRYYKVAVYIRFFNQTQYSDEEYLEKHKVQFLDTIGSCPNWEFVDFYVDKGQTAPRMENAKEWSRLLTDAIAGKVDLIITQKVSNVSRDSSEVAFCTRLLASQKHPIGVYFISEDVFSLASYYLEDLHDPEFFPSPTWPSLPDDDDDDEDEFGGEEE